MEMQTQLGNTIEWNGQTVQQNEALRLLQEPRGDMRLRVERALTSMVSHDFAIFCYISKEAYGLSDSYSS